LTKEIFMTTRIYHVTHNRTGKVRLIRAMSQAQAIRYAANTEFGIRVASQDDIVFGLSQGGIPVEDSGPKQAELALEGPGHE
jgi:hypothetical protein